VRYSNSEGKGRDRVFWKSGRNSLKRSRNVLLMLVQKRGSLIMDSPSS